MLTVILTGGGSRRMGRDKAVLPWDGGTMSQFLIDKYACLGPVAVSVDRAGRFPYKNALELEDPFPGLGPMNGLVAAFSQTAAETVFMTATDLPFGDPALVKRLAELLGDADACVMRRGVKGVEPLFAVYSRGCCLPARECLSAGVKSLRELLSRVRVRYVEAEELAGFDLDKILRNINTAEEYESALKG